RPFHRDHRRFVQNNPLAFHIDEGIRGAEIDSDVVDRDEPSRVQQVPEPHSLFRFDPSKGPAGERRRRPAPSRERTCSRASGRANKLTAMHISGKRSVTVPAAPPADASTGTRRWTPKPPF